MNAETSSSIPTLVSRLTSPVHGPLASYLSPLFGLTCNPSPVQRSAYHSLGFCFYQKIKILICYSIWVRGSHKACCQCPGHPDQQQWLSQEREKRVFNGRHENKLSRTVSRAGIPPGKSVSWFLYPNALSGHTDLLLAKKRMMKIVSLLLLFVSL